MERHRDPTYKRQQLTLSISIVVLAVIGISAAIGRTLAIIYGEAVTGLLLKTIPPGFRDEALDFNLWFADYPWLTLLHVIPGAFFLAAAPFQFLSTIRDRYPRLHRWSGRVLISSGLLVGISGLFLAAMFPFGGYSAASAATVLGVAFIIALTRAYLAIRKRDFIKHREWMIRMFALGLGIATIRVIGLLIHLMTGSKFDQIVGWSFWIGWLVTFAVAEWWLRHTRSFSG